jgi:hypothetical protein
MKQKLSYALRIIVFVMMSLATSPAQAAKLEQIGPYYATPSWDQTLPANTRFIVLTNMNNAAVLDKETGLVWQQSPSTDYIDWYSAQSQCNNLTMGNRLGWRLPTIQELASLVDRSADPTLPAGHPFNVLSSNYWSATTRATFDTDAWFVDFSLGLLMTGTKSNTQNRVWCVRGGQGTDPQ